MMRFKPAVVVSTTSIAADKAGTLCVFDYKKSGGEGGIRTPGTAFDRTTV
jgi:hypothetical protein